jgi:hypothetical protein
MKTRLVLGVLVTLAVCSVFAIAGAAPAGGTDEVLYRGTPYCVNNDDCEAFANWGPTTAGYIELLEPDGSGQVSDYLWVDFTGHLWFESRDPGGTFAALPPAGLPLLGTLVEDGTLQEVDQFFPGGETRPLFVESDSTTPEPSTLLLVGPAAVFLFNRARRLKRN